MELILERNNRFIKLWLQFFFSVVIHPSLKLDLFWEKISWIFLYLPDEGAISPCIFWWSKTKRSVLTKNYPSYSHFLSPFFPPPLLPTTSPLFLIPHLHYVSQPVSDVIAGCVCSSHSLLTSCWPSTILPSDKLEGKRMAETLNHPLF